MYIIAFYIFWCAAQRPQITWCGAQRPDTKGAPWCACWCAAERPETAWCGAQRPESRVALAQFLQCHRRVQDNITIAQGAHAAHHGVMIPWLHGGGLRPSLWLQLFALAAVLVTDMYINNLHLALATAPATACPRCGTCHRRQGPQITKDSRHHGQTQRTFFGKTRRVRDTESFQSLH